MQMGESDKLIINVYILSINEKKLDRSLLVCIVVYKITIITLLM
jgi:hypothetical protein